MLFITDRSRGVAFASLHMDVKDPVSLCSHITNSLYLNIMLGVNSTSGLFFFFSLFLGLPV